MNYVFKLTENGETLTLSNYVLKTFGTCGIVKELHTDNLEEITDYLEMVTIISAYPFLVDAIYDTEYNEADNETFAEYRAKLDDMTLDEPHIVSYQVFRLLKGSYEQISFIPPINYDETLLALARR